MPTVRYDMIEPNVAATDVDGENLTITWKCPVSGKVVGKSQAMMQPANSTTRSMAQATQRSLLESGIQALIAFINSTFGGVAGNVASAASYPARTGAMQQIGRPVYSRASENDAAVQAFEQVKDKFRWDENRELFVAVQ